MDNQVDEFVALLRKTPGVEVSVDRPDDPLGESFIDITGPGIETQVSYRPPAGFGLFTTNQTFGQRPDLLITDPVAAVERVLADVAVADVEPMPLALPRR